MKMAGENPESFLFPMRPKACVILFRLIKNQDFENRKDPLLTFKKILIHILNVFASIFPRINAVPYEQFRNKQ